jgi:hypothetical protein
MRSITISPSRTQDMSIERRGKKEAEEGVRKGIKVRTKATQT